MKEILTEYGDLCLIWFDTPAGMPKDCCMELYNMVKQYQPDCLVNTRICQDGTVGDYVSMGDNELPETQMNMLAEAPITLNDTWGYKSFDENWKSKEQVLSILNKCNRRGANMLLNVGPDALGRFPAPAIEILNSLSR